MKYATGFMFGVLFMLLLWVSIAIYYERGTTNIINDGCYFDAYGYATASVPLDELWYGDGCKK